MARIYQARTVRSILRDHDRAIRQNASASTFARSGLSVTAEGVTTVQGDLVVDGNFTATGKISNDALTDPVIPGVANVTTNSFSLSNAFVERAGVDLTVPSGCTRLLATCSVWLQAFNQNTTGGSNGAGADYVYVYASIGGTNGDYKATGISGSNGTASTGSGLSALLSGLTPGGTVRLSAYCSSQYTVIAASSNNSATLSASLMWLR